MSVTQEQARCVVVGVDDFKESLHAVTLAAQEAAARRAPLQVVHAMMWPGWDPPAETGDQQARERAHAMVDAAAEVARAAVPGLDVRTEIVAGTAAEVLLWESKHAQLVVIGHSELGEVSALLTGAIGRHLAGHTACPLLIVRRAGAPDGPVIVGVDDLTASDDLLDVAFDQCGRSGRTLTVVHAWHLPTTLFGHVAEPYSYDLLAAAALETLAAEVERAQVRHPGIPVSYLSRYGPTTEALLDAATAASLLIVGSRGAGAFRSAVLGSVATAMSRHANCPVLVVPTARGPVI